MSRELTDIIMMSAEDGLNNFRDDLKIKIEAGATWQLLKACRTVYDCERGYYDSVVKEIKEEKLNRFSAMGYKQRVEMKNEHPELYKELAEMELGKSYR